MRAVLLASATAATFAGLRANSCVSQRYFSGWARACLITAKADDQHAPQVSIALLGDGSQPLLAAGRILARDDADPGREVTPRLEDRSIRNRGDNGTRAEDANARNGLKPFAVPVFAMLSEKALLDGTNLGLARGNLRHKRREASACILGQAGIATVGDDCKQNLQTVMALWSDDAELSQTRA